MAEKKYSGGTNRSTPRSGGKRTAPQKRAAMKKRQDEVYGPNAVETYLGAVRRGYNGPFWSTDAQYQKDRAMQNGTVVRGPSAPKKSGRKKS